MSNTTPIENLASLRIGTVEFVSPDEIKVLLDTEAPDNIALNAGMPRPFPRVNGYLLIPVDQGFVVGQITWITIERSNFPIRKGFKDFGLIDLPFPLRKVDLHLVGTLTRDETKYKFSRGIEGFPSVGDIVLLPSDLQLKGIIESGEKRRVYIGNSVLVDGAKIKIDPDKLFGRHLAVLGNTGSGKSCTVAGLIRWSLENAKHGLVDRNNQQTNSRFILLDPNGEYSKAFNDIKEAKVFSVEPEGAEKMLQVPLWMWNTDEWCGFTQATAKTQRPTIINALKNMRRGIEHSLSKENALTVYLRTLIISLRITIEEGSPWSPKRGLRKGFYELLGIWRSGIYISDEFNENLKTAIDDLTQAIDTMLSKYVGTGYYSYSFTPLELNDIFSKTHTAYINAGGLEEYITMDPDTPIPFKGNIFVEAIKASAELLHTSEYIDSTINMIKSILNDARLKDVIECENITLEQWLDQYVGENHKNSLTIIDLSLLPNHVVTTVTTVISRIIFESLQRYRKQTKQCLPTVLVVEEAHHFIKRYNDDFESLGSGILCCKVFERIAREGRKFGLGLVISSQRPSELSPTVLSQCNTFMIHRISNDRDQELIGRLLPDNMRSMLRELPSLPSQNAILLGWATELPTLIKMRDLPEDQRPQSNDPDFWDVWTYRKKRDVNWKDLADDWQK